MSIQENPTAVERRCVKEKDFGRAVESYSRSNPHCMILDRPPFARKGVAIQSFRRLLSVTEEEGGWAYH